MLLGFNGRFVGVGWVFRFNVTSFLFLWLSSTDFSRLHGDRKVSFFYWVFFFFIWFYAGPLLAVPCVVLFRVTAAPFLDDFNVLAIRMPFVMVTTMQRRDSTRSLADGAPCLPGGRDLTALIGSHGVPRPHSNWTAPTRRINAGPVLKLGAQIAVEPKGRTSVYYPTTDFRTCYLHCPLDQNWSAKIFIRRLLINKSWTWKNGESFHSNKI